jgi:hypothetical protein
MYIRKWAEVLRLGIERSDGLRRHVGGLMWDDEKRVTGGWAWRIEEVVGSVGGLDEKGW